MLGVTVLCIHVGFPLRTTSWKFLFPLVSLVVFSNRWHLSIWPALLVRDNLMVGMTETNRLSECLTGLSVKLDGISCVTCAGLLPMRCPCHDIKTLESGLAEYARALGQIQADPTIRFSYLNLT
jgi:hypothetical protein